MVSIITVCFNSARTIERTIKSVLAQTDNACEHIIVDGKSNDQTLETIEKLKSKYKKKGIHLHLISEPDNGCYDAMNKGISLAVGDRIGILNSDDAYDNNTVAIVNRIDKMMKKKENRSDIIMGAIRIHNGNRVIIKKARIDRFYQTSRHFNHPAMFVTKDFYKKIGKYKTDNVHDDYRWYLKAVKNGATVQITEKVLTDFYTGGVSASQGISDIKRHIQKKYEAYRTEGYSPLYFFECVGMEVMKYLLISTLVH